MLFGNVLSTGGTQFGVYPKPAACEDSRKLTLPRPSTLLHKEELFILAEYFIRRFIEDPAVTLFLQYLVLATSARFVGMAKN